MADDEDTDDADDTEANCLVPDPFVTALELCRIASSPKTIATALKKLRKLGRDWRQIKQMVPNLPDDLPPTAPSTEVSENVTQDWAGSQFMPGTSLTRTVRGAA